MKSTKIKLYLSLAFLTLHFFTNAQQSVKVTPAGTQYLEYLPSGYNSPVDGCITYATYPPVTECKKYPVLIALHGKGETDLNRVRNIGPSKQIEQGNKMCFGGECFIVISPLMPNQSVGYWSASVIKELSDHVLSFYRVDRSRIYLTGLSMGGNGVYIGLSQTPDIFAAGLVLAGYGNSQSCEIAKRQIPIWGIHGENDGTVRYGDGWTEFMRTQWCAKDEVRVIPGEQIWTKVPGAGHDVWTQYYSDPKVYEWLLSKRKGVVTVPPVVEPPVVVPPVVIPKSTITIEGKVYEITLTPK